MIGIPLALLTANATEWVVHKYVLHGLGKRKSSFWSFHWHEHHRNVHRHEHRDPDYERSVFRWNGMGKEAATLAAASVAIVPLLPVMPAFTMTMWYSAINYYRKHKRSHLDVAWARQRLPWHYDHHMGPNPDSNWCVTRPWFDVIMGTREPYLGTEREHRDRTRTKARENATAPA